MRRFVPILVSIALITCLTTGGFAQRASDLGWQRYTGPNGTRDEVPTRLFAGRSGPAEKGIGEEWMTTDGRGRLSIYVLRNSDGYTPRGYLKRFLTDRPSQIDYKRITATFFAVSKVGGNRIFYRRCNFAQNIHCVELAYPKEEKRAWDPIVTRISLSLRPLVSHAQAAGD